MERHCAMMQRRVAWKPCVEVFQHSTTYGQHRRGCRQHHGPRSSMLEAGSWDTNGSWAQDLYARACWQGLSRVWPLADDTAGRVVGGRPSALACAAALHRHRWPRLLGRLARGRQNPLCIDGHHFAVDGLDQGAAGCGAPALGLGRHARGSLAALPLPRLGARQVAQLCHLLRNAMKKMSHSVCTHGRMVESAKRTCARNRRISSRCWRTFASSLSWESARKRSLPSRVGPHPAFSAPLVVACESSKMIGVRAWSSGVKHIVMVMSSTRGDYSHVPIATCFQCLGKTFYQSSA